MFLGPHKKCCMVECIMNSTGILVNGNINEAIAKKVMTQSVINDPAWVKVINAAIDKCMIDGKIFIVHFKIVNLKFNHY